MADQLVQVLTPSAVLRPYVCPLAVEWLANNPELRYRCVTGTLVFADVSGFTRLTERLAKRGRAGAEEISDLLDFVLGALLDAASVQGGWLVKWGGDALLVMFDGPGHAERACAAAVDMRSVIGRVGRLDTSVGHIRLRMSVSAHSGEVDFILAGRRHRELVVTGATATVTAKLEGDASAGQVLIGPSTAALLAPGCLGEPLGGGVLLARRPKAPPPPPAPDAGIVHPVGLERAMDPAEIEALLAGAGAGEHRGVAVSFVEFRGVGELSERRGPAGVVEAVDRLVTVCQDAAARFGVTFHETDIGPDGGKILLVAGAPVAMDAPEEALLCTVRETIERAGDQLALRAGITAGRVFSGGLGPAYRRSYSVKGDVINLAARIMGKAAPGEVLALPEVVAGSATPFEVTPREPFMVKGKVRPVSTVVVGAARRRGSQGDGAKPSLPLCGRDAEMVALDAAMERARAGGTGSLVEITGGPGGGKSRLLAEAAARAAMTVVRCGGEPFLAATPYHVLGVLLAEVLGIGDERDPVVRTARLRAWADAVAPELTEWLPLLGRALGVTLPDTDATAALDEAYRVARLHDVVLGALDAAVPGPTLFVVDDAQHCDEASYAAFRRIAAALERRPWVLILAHRPWEKDEAVLDPASGVFHVGLELGPLDDAAATELVRHDTADAPLARHVVAAVVARAGGQPLFLRELARAARTGATELPDSVERVLASRIDRLAPADRRVLRACAVQGTIADPVLTGRLLESALDSHALGRLSAFLSADVDGWRFRDQLAREVAYEGLPFRQRAELHSRLADELAAAGDTPADEALLSEHYFLAARFGPALRHARAAARSALDRYAYVEATVAYERALAAGRRLGDVDRDELATLWYELGETRRRLGEYPAAESAYGTARRLATDPVAKAKSTERWALSAGWRGAYRLGRRRARSGLAGLDGRAPDPTGPLSGPLADARNDLLLREAYLDFQQGRHREARHAAGAVADDPRAGLRQRALAYQLLDAAGATLGDDSDGRYAEESLAAYRQLGDMLAEGRLLLQLGARAYFAGRWVLAIERYEEAETAYARGGDTAKVTLVSSNIAEVLVEQWRLEEAERRLREVERDWQASGAGNLLAFAWLLLGRVLARAGREVEGLERLQAAREAFAAQDSRADVVDADTYLAEAASMAGRHDEAIALAQATLRRAAALADLPVQGPLLGRIVGTSMDAQHRWDEAGTALEESLRVARARRARHDVAFTLAAMAAHRRLAGLAPDPSLEAEARGLAGDLGLAVDLFSGLETAGAGAT